MENRIFKKKQLSVICELLFWVLFTEDINMAWMWSQIRVNFAFSDSFGSKKGNSRGISWVTKDEWSQSQGWHSWFYLCRNQKVFPFILSQENRAFIPECLDLETPSMLNIKANPTFHRDLFHHMLIPSCQIWLSTCSPCHQGNSSDTCSMDLIDNSRFRWLLLLAPPASN